MATRKNITKSEDAALLKLGALLHQQMDEAYSHYGKSCVLKAPLSGSWSG